ncbi:ATP-binding cassette domain-containing protein [Qipengyuania atrilutea]|uniref:ATP-binding cassette domain-containing protein n=1 Tax=Qipengyuania atrilutea TaxID=2744473 RepID=A0A850H4I6_9SPHN|nr:ATP-binding cassette domain-containing protein [Actirhodobacter atriluteus]NVD44783.1 ATP-binding cassette domain-containing protein [Actirhodobacter atriluteus]
MPDSATPALEWRGVSRTFGDVQAVEDVSVAVAGGSFTALVGASGSGKSTLLKIVNRLVEPDSGKVFVHGQDTSDMPRSVLRRRIGYVFQQIGLFPHMDAGQNIGIGARLSGNRLPPERIAELLELVELDPQMAARMPQEFSGGQQQRIGVARALANEPEILLMDEPFGALDPLTRDALGRRVRALHERLGLTSVMVTHDMAEALLLADRVLVMDAGRIEADETPASLLAGRGGAIAQAMVAVPREQAKRLSAVRE